MTIPAPLAFAPTALRNVAAGLVVGNPVGSSGTRAKALTSAQLKAIVEASGISYLPLAGGTLTGPITGTGGLIEQRDGLTAQCFDLFETYTSSTNNGKLRFKATSSGHQIGSARASSGSNRAVQFGHFDSVGTFANAMSIATDGGVSASKFGAGGAAYANYPLTVNGDAIFRDAAASAFVCFHGKSGSWLGNSDDNYAFASYKPSLYFFTNGEYLTTAAAALALTPTNVTLGKALIPKTLADSAAPNGSVYYSSTQSKLVYKDSGGTVNVLY